MRKYQPIWELIKKDHTASLAADSKLHKRIIMGVRKEKIKDVGWKLLLLEKHIKYELIEEIKGELITFYLRDISPITINDL